MPVLVWLGSLASFCRGQNLPVAPFSVRAFCTISSSSGPLQVYFVWISCGKMQVFLCSRHKMMWKFGCVFGKNDVFACVFIQFWPRIMWKLTSFGGGSAGTISVISSNWERQNVACVAYLSSFLSKKCRIQCAFRVVFRFFFPSRCGAVQVFFENVVFPMTSIRTQTAHFVFFFTFAATSAGGLSSCELEWGDWYTSIGKRASKPQSILIGFLAALEWMLCTHSKIVPVCTWMTSRPLFISAVNWPAEWFTTPWRRFKVEDILL